MNRTLISLSLLFLILTIFGCDRTPSSKLAHENARLKSRIALLETKLSVMANGEIDPTVSMGRELQTFEDMYTACQKAHPDWRYLDNE